MTKWLPNPVTKVIDRCYETTGRASFICDFSPPRSGDSSIIKQADFAADFISVAYNPGRTVRANSAMLATGIRRQTGKDVIFTLATRDMNKLATQSLLLGAQLLDLENAVIVQGDQFAHSDLELVSPVNDYVTTALIAAIARMNQGSDFRARRLDAPTDFCIGGTVDLSRGIEPEAKLAGEKVRSGAQFLMTEPIFSSEEGTRFLEVYNDQPDATPSVPTFFGLQILEPDSVTFSSVPKQVRDGLQNGQSGVDLALHLYHEFRTAGLHNIYLVPPIRRGGIRNYAAAQEFLSTVN